MNVRSEQIQTLEVHAQDSFVREMAEHLKTFAPKVCEIVGDPAVREIAQLGIQRARSYDIRNRGPVRFYLELMSSLGSGFDTDPQLPWAAETLKDGSIRTDMLRADRLFQRLVAYLDQVAGPDNQYATDALNRFLQFNPDAPPREGWTQQAVLRVMSHIYPQKLNFIGENIAQAILRKATDEAASYGLPAQKGAVVLAGAEFAMGHQICEDPFYPWIAGTLKDPRIVDPEAKLKRLTSKLQTYAKHVLAYVTQS